MPPQLPLRGDRSQRVTVALPQSLNDLESSAKNAFGAGVNRSKMYHRGETVLDQRAYQNVQDGDVVIVRKGTPTVASTYPRDMLTTHASAYVAHPMEQRRAPSTPAPTRPGMKAPKFQGTSCYAEAYIGHPMDTKEKERPPIPSAWEPNNIPMSSRSTYAENFPWHASQPKSPGNGKPAPKTPRGNSQVPFNGQSSYKIDYIKHASERPKSADGTRRDRQRQDRPGVPFSGSTTYNGDYKKHPQDRTPKPESNTGPFRRDQPMNSPKFQGNSEYQNEYIKKERQRMAMIHLEPETSRRGSRTSSRG